MKPRSSTDLIDAETARNHISYNENTGVFTWKKTRRGVKSGSVAGHINTNGYTYIRILNKRYLAHRLAWLYANGYFPDEEIDHINRNRSDNRIANLRIATRIENAHNTSMPVTNKTGAIGVDWHKGANKFRARLVTDWKSVHLGLFNTVEEASAAREEAIKIYRDGKSHANT